MDCQMPVMDYEATEKIRIWEKKKNNNRERTHIIAMTANVMEEIRKNVFLMVWMGIFKTSRI